MLNPKLIELYQEGDAIGAAYEGVGPSKDRGRHPVAGGTDETDIVRCWHEYLASGQSITPEGWAKYITDHHRVCGYGGTMRDFFRTVKHLDKSGELAYEKLIGISKDRNGAGNACLPLVPCIVAWSAARLFGSTIQHVLMFTQLSHHSDLSSRACITLVLLLLTAPDRWEEVWGNPSRELVMGGSDAMSTLATAYHLSGIADKQELINECLSIGGDTDSILALALLLWGVRMEGLDVVV